MYNKTLITQVLYKACSAESDGKMIPEYISGSLKIGKIGRQCSDV
jgi:hypothetical protein